MNPETLALIVRFIDIAERAYIQVKGIIDREKSGNPLTDAELDALKNDSDAAHAVIQAWTPSVN